MSADRTPVIVAIGVVEQRLDDVAAAREPLELMIEAVRCAAADAGEARLASHADSVRVPRGFWDYSDPGRRVAEVLGASRARTTVGEIGVLQQTLMNEACVAIAEGREQLAIVVGGEARYRSLRAKITGVPDTRTIQTGEPPDRTLAPAGSLWSEHEAAQGLIMPVQYYAVMENALRHADGQSLDAHRALLAALYEGFSRVAAGNPHAWGPAGVAAEEIATIGPRNPMLAFPYAKLHTSSWNVDQAGALVYASLSFARELGLDESKFVHPLVGTESNHMTALSARPQLHENLGAELASQRALELAAVDADALTALDLYSCFPAAVRIFARALGLDERGFAAHPPTVTGGMPFAGGPLNNYVLQSTARMVERLREHPAGDARALGLVSCVSGMITKSGIGLYGRAPRDGGFAFEDVSGEVAAQGGEKQIVADYTGPAVVAGYTVIHLGELPARGIVVCDLPDGRRALAASENPDRCRAMTEVEVCGRPVTIGPGGVLERIDGLI